MCAYITYYLFIINNIIIFQFIIIILDLKVHIQDSINTIINVSYAVDIYVTQVDTYIHTYIFKRRNRKRQKQKHGSQQY